MRQEPLSNACARNGADVIVARERVFINFFYFKGAKKMAANADLTWSRRAYGRTGRISGHPFRIVDHSIPYPGSRMYLCGMYGTNEDGEKADLMQPIDGIELRRYVSCCWQDPGGADRSNWVLIRSYLVPVSRIHAKREDKKLSRSSTMQCSRTE